MTPNISIGMKSSLTVSHMLCAVSVLVGVTAELPFPTLVHLSMVTIRPSAPAVLMNNKNKKLNKSEQQFTNVRQTHGLCTQMANGMRGAETSRASMKPTVVITHYFRYVDRMQNACDGSFDGHELIKKKNEDRETDEAYYCLVTSVFIPCGHCGV